MNKALYIVILGVAMFGVYGCISLNTTGLKHLSREQRSMIVKPTKPLDQLTVSDTIYTVNDSMVKEWLADKDYAIVHSYLTWCRGDHCINPVIVVNDLKEAGLPFLMIAGDFESKNGYRANYPFMCIDFDYYNTKNYSTGIEKMFRALGCGESWWQLYSLFHRGEFVGSAETLPELMRIYSINKGNKV